ncbi:interleukin-7 receptor subunit alpha [Elgaria multicarinata webbii]|uniref:interleukin-7 receptor subunit alpha n=1 Tax=Elgaria multicarinata webbii TaxID=159646 RepID=UPI002FCCDC1C
MTMMSPALYSYFFILLVAVAAESGSGSGASLGYGTCADAEMDISFECFIQMPVFQRNFLICNITRAEMNLNEVNISFTASCNKPCKCSMASQLVCNCTLQSTDIIDSLDVCLFMTTMNAECKACQKVEAVTIIKPEAPFGLNVTYQEKANEYFVQFSTPHSSGSYLHNKLIHELDYRQKNKPWSTKGSGYTTLKLLGKDFQPGAMYEMRVRSKPNGDYFKGSWSEWSCSTYFDTPAIVSDEISKYDIIKITISIVAFVMLFILISLIPKFWKNRIKPIVWPTLPNHEKTLDKLFHKLRKNSDASFFNPESFEYVHIHKVDSIQAKPEMDRLQPLSLPWDPDVLEKVGNGLEQKTNLNHINHGWLKLPLAYEGMWPAEMLNFHLGRSTHTSDGNRLIRANQYEDNSTGGQRGCSNGHDSTSSMDLTILSGSEADPCHQAYTNSETRVPNNEEAYVTMASFFGNKGKLGN